MLIPKIIHQVYEDPSGPPESLSVLAQTWREFHPDWEYVFWPRDKIVDFMNTSFSDLLPIYTSFPFNVQRWDFLRYLILYKYGGLYVDMDYECLEPIEPLLSGATCVLGLEPPEHAYLNNNQPIIGNAFMASIPECPFFQLVLEYIQQHGSNLEGIEKKGYYIMTTTGPFMVSKIYNLFPDKKNIKLVLAELVAPLTVDEIRNFVAGNITKEMENKVEKAAAIHYFMGSWWKEMK